MWGHGDSQSCGHQHGPTPNQASPRSSQVGWKGWIWQDTLCHLDKGPGRHQGLLKAEGPVD